MFVFVCVIIEVRYLRLRGRSLNANMARVTTFVVIALVLALALTVRVNANSTCETQCMSTLGADNCTFNRTLDMLPRLANYFAVLPALMPVLYAAQPSQRCCGGHTVECPPSVNVTYNCTTSFPGLLTLMTEPSNVYFCPDTCVPLACGGADIVEGDIGLIPDRSCANGATEFFSCRWFIPIVDICEWRCRDEADWHCGDCPACNVTCT